MDCSSDANFVNPGLAKLFVVFELLAADADELVLSLESVEESKSLMLDEDPAAPDR
jgi:hypothetical protein